VPDTLLCDPRIYLTPARSYPDPTAKRNAAFTWSKRIGAGWVVWLDGDELLLWGEYLPDMIGRAEAEETAVGGFPLRIVEADGSVGLNYGRVVRTTAVRKYVLDASQAELHTGVVVGLPNEKICAAGGVPYGPFPHEQAPDGTLVPAQPGSEPVERYLARHRPPLNGEPHVLHRTLLRAPERASVRRLSEVEADAWVPPDRAGYAMDDQARKWAREGRAERRSTS